MSSASLPNSLYALPHPLFVLADDGAVGVPNLRWRELFGESTHWPDMIAPQRQSSWKQQWKEAKTNKSGFRFDTPIRNSQGWTRCLLSIEPQMGDDSERWLVVAMEFEDVLEEIVADYEQDRVAQSITARRWQSFFEDSATGKAMVSVDGEILVVNPEMCRIFGYSEAELLQMSPRDLRHPEDQSRLDLIYSALLEGDPPISGVEGRYKRRSGRDIYLLLSFSLVRDSMGHPLYFAVEMQDDTARRQAEESLAEQAERMAVVNEDLARSNSELERFAFIASHDLQEPLRKIRVFAGRLQKEAERSQLTEASQDYLTRLVSASERMQQLIADLLAFSRLSRPPRFETVDLTELVDELSGDFETSLEESGGRLEIGPLPQVEGDSSRLRQLLANLISNALKFHGTEPPLVRVRARPIDCPPEAKLHREAPWWELSVQDNGIGFEESELPALLEVFGRLHSKERYPGTGIGLAICRKVAQEHGGDITARSQLGQGTTFLVTLPERQTSSRSAPYHLAEGRAEG